MRCYYSTKSKALRRQKEYIKSVKTSPDFYEWEGQLQQQHDENGYWSIVDEVIDDIIVTYFNGIME